MSDVETILRLAAVAVLAACLYLRHRRRVRRRRFDLAGWTGRGIDVTILAPRIEAVRRDHLAARQPARGAGFHRALLDWARQAVVRLGYFHGRRSEDHARTHGS